MGLYGKIGNMKTVKPLLLFCACLFGIIAGGYSYFARTVPPLKDVDKYTPALATRVYSADGEVIGEFYLQRRFLVPKEEIPKLLKQAFVAAEDADFYRHKGVSWIGIVRALMKNLEAGRVVQGGSTITQQLVRSLILDPEKTLSRKIREVILARRIEKHLSKDDILYLYLNQIYLGHGNYGIGAAADYYFGKSPKELNLAEMALLAGLPKAPEVYSPYKNFLLAKKRQEYVLKRMVEEGYISEEEAKQAYNAPLKLREHDPHNKDIYAYYLEYVRNYLVERYGKKAVYEGGLEVYTAVDSRLQRAAYWAIREGLLALNKRQGFKGPEEILKEEEIKAFLSSLKGENRNIEVGGVYKGVVLRESPEGVWVDLGRSQGLVPRESLSWVRQNLKRGCVVKVRVVEKNRSLRLELYGEPQVEGALLAMELPSGYVRAMIGGWDFYRSQFNRALQARRQAGSAFKPIVYAAALTKGYNPSSLVLDAPVVFREGDRIWRPENYQRKFYGPVSLRFALAQSLNCATVNLANEIGVDYIIRFARRLGLTSPLPRDLSLSLGSSSVTLLELVRAYAVFATGGHLIEPIFVSKVLDRKGNVLEERKPLPLEGELRRYGLEPKGMVSPQVLSSGIAYLVTNMLQSVIEEGTGWRAKVLGRPCAGKTGTTDNYTDAWFIGYIPRLIAGVWVGFDEPRPLGEDETGSKAAAPIWVSFMKEAMKEYPPEDFPVPDDIIFLRINPETGQLASPDEPGIFAPFLRETEPNGPSPSVEEPSQG